MKNLIPAFLVILFALLNGSLAAQDTDLGNVSNVDWNYDTLTEKIVITYDLSRVGTERYFQVSVSAIFDGQPFTPSTAALEGDVGNYIRSGLQKQILWDVSQDIFFTENTSLQIKVTSRKVQSADTGGNTVAPALPEPNIFIPIGAGVLGGGLIAAGLGSKNSDDVKNYESTCDPESPSFRSTAVEVGSDGLSECDMLYDEAKKAHDTGNLLMTLGIGVVIVGTGWFVKQKLDEAAAISTLRTSENGAAKLIIKPALGLNPVVWNGNPVGTLGLTFLFKLNDQ